MDNQRYRVIYELWMMGTGGVNWKIRDTQNSNIIVSEGRTITLWGAKREAKRRLRFLERIDNANRN